MELLKQNLFALLMAVVLTGSIVYTAGFMYSKIEDISADLDDVVESIDRIEVELRHVDARLTRIDEHLNGRYTYSP